MNADEVRPTDPDCSPRYYRVPPAYHQHGGGSGGLPPGAPPNYPNYYRPRPDPANSPTFERKVPRGGGRPPQKTHKKKHKKGGVGIGDHLEDTSTTLTSSDLLSKTPKHVSFAFAGDPNYANARLQYPYNLADKGPTALTRLAKCVPQKSTSYAKGFC